MAARTKARKRAIDLLFEAEQRQVNARDLLKERLAAPVTEAPLTEFTADLVVGVVDKTFNAGTKVEVATVDKRAMTYLYKEGTDYVFMDGDTFDQLYVPEQTLGTVKDYLLENMEAVVAMHEGAALYVELPASVELLVAHTDPGLQGDRSTGGTKPATLETGHTIAVPLFITTGEKVKVDTRDSSYLGRVKA